MVLANQEANMYQYVITRIAPGNNEAGERLLNQYGKEGYHVVAWAPFNLEVILVLEKEVTETSPAAEPPKRRTVTVIAP
jgi:hypothetical protein